MLIWFQWIQDGEGGQLKAVRIDNPNQFAPQGANPKEFKEKQKQVNSYHFYLFAVILSGCTILAFLPDGHRTFFNNFILTQIFEKVIKLSNKKSLVFSHSNQRTSQTKYLGLLAFVSKIGTYDKPFVENFVHH